MFGHWKYSDSLVEIELNRAPPKAAVSDVTKAIFFMFLFFNAITNFAKSPSSQGRPRHLFCPSPASCSRLWLALAPFPVRQHFCITSSQRTATQGLHDIDLECTEGELMRREPGCLRVTSAGATVARCGTLTPRRKAGGSHAGARQQRKLSQCHLGYPRPITPPRNRHLAFRLLHYAFTQHLKRCKVERISTSSAGKATGMGVTQGVLQYSR